MYNMLSDDRIKCLSIIINMPMRTYLELIADVYAEDGGLENQRGPLKTKTAVTIRKRMVSDIQAGAVLPPVVLGVLVESGLLPEFEAITTSHSLLGKLTGPARQVQLSIIDGMQRTTAMKNAVDLDPEAGARNIRVEFWVAELISSLIYRMLILNTGQVPWELARQLQTVYAQFLTRISGELGHDVEIFLKDDDRRRSSAAQYQASSIIELLLIFSSRRTELDIRDKVAEDFARLDAIEGTSHSGFLDDFVATLKLMAKLDRAFALGDEPSDRKRFRKGKDIFASFPALVGFCAAVSIYLFDEPGFDTEWDAVPRKLAEVQVAITKLTDRINRMDAHDASEFLQLDLVEERLKTRSTQVGRFEREFFRNAFSKLIILAERLPNLAPCWRA